MSQLPSPSRRLLLRRVAVGASLIPLGSVGLRCALASPAALLSVDAPEARAVKYVEDARKAQGATADSTCANCGLYQGKSGSTQGPCQLFPGKDVKAAGWCSSWTPQM